MTSSTVGSNRWIPLASATLSMMLIGLYQYSWTMFTIPLESEFKATASAIQLAFTIFTWTMTLTQPVSGYVADKHGTLLLNIVGGIIAGLGWMLSSSVSTPQALYLTYGFGGTGTGIIYGTSIGTANRWFPDRRGLATGLVAFGYGFGAAIFNPVISWITSSSSFRSALLYIGIGMLVFLTVMGFFSRYPPSRWQPPRKPGQTIAAGREVTKQVSPKEMVTTSQWWLIYVSFVLTANTGLMVAAQLTNMGKSLSIPSNLIVLTSSLFPIANGLGRIVGGMVSDRIGRGRAMMLFFALQGIFALCLLGFGATGVAFVASVTMIGFFWGPVFTFYPSITADYFGQRNSTANYGITYTAKGWGGLTGGYVAALLSATYGGYATPILASALLSFTASLMVSPKLLRKP